jgi:hypothetical protein
MVAFASTPQLNCVDNDGEASAADNLTGKCQHALMSGPMREITVTDDKRRKRLRSIAITRSLTVILLDLSTPNRPIGMLGALFQTIRAAGVRISVSTRRAHCCNQDCRNTSPLNSFLLFAHSDPIRCQRRNLDTRLRIRHLCHPL